MLEIIIAVSLAAVILVFSCVLTNVNGKDKEESDKTEK